MGHLRIVKINKKSDYKNIKTLGMKENLIPSSYNLEKEFLVKRMKLFILLIKYFYNFFIPLKGPKDVSKNNIIARNFKIMIFFFETIKKVFFSSNLTLLKNLFFYCKNLNQIYLL